MTPRDFADQVRSQADIVRIIGDYVTLKKRGTNYTALCPFHREKTPSFAVHPAKQIFKCFGCSLGGDVFKFVMQMEGGSWWEAVKTVAEKSGIPVPRFDAERPRAEAEPQAEWRERLLQINSVACEFFERCLTEHSGQAARDYLASRGLRSETIRRLRIGYAPESWDSLLGFLVSRRVTREELERSGLVVGRQDGSGFYDRFRHRIIFPIADVQGRIIAFGGRALRDDEPKYLNSPETALYTKGRHLYGLTYSREAIRRAGYAILVEGYFDFASVFQQGVEHVVASLGTALTEDQVRLLKRTVSKVVFNFDADPAGKSAMKRSLETLIHGGCEVSILTLPEGEDPDSFVRRSGASAYVELAEKAMSFIEFALAQALAGKEFTNPTVRARAVKELALSLALIPDKIERVASADYVAGRLRVDSRLVRDEVRHQMQTASKPGAQPESQPPVESEDRLSAPARKATVTPAEQRLIEIVLNHDEARRRVLSEMTAADIRGLAGERFFEILLQSDSHTVDYQDLAERLAGDAFSLDLVERAMMIELVGDADDLLSQALACLQSLRRRRLNLELDSLQAEIENAKEHGEGEMINQLLLRKAELARFLAKGLSR
jgi:DNA primase